MKIEVLYPEIANLYGDLENVSYLKKSYPEIEIIQTHLADEPMFVKEKPDLIYMGTMTESGQLLVIERLSVYKEELRNRIDDGTLFLITGNALEVFGEIIKDKDGTECKGLGVFPIISKRDKLNRFNSLYLGTFEEMTIVGYKSQFTHSYVNEDGKSGSGIEFQSAMESRRGPGLNPEQAGEGIRVNHFIATYVIGPILVLNPPLAKWILQKMGVAEPVLAFEDAAMDAYEVRVKEYSDPNTGFYY